MLTETILPLASVTVVVTDPSALVVTLVVSLEDELLPEEDDELALALDALGAALVAATSDRAEVLAEAALMLPLMGRCSSC